MNFLRLMIVSAVVTCAGCGGNSGDDASNDDAEGQNAEIAASLLNGYVLTAIVNSDDSGAITNTSVNYDTDSNTIEWITLDSAGAMTLRDELLYNESGRIVSADRYDGAGALQRSETYTIEGGLIRERISADNELTFSYTNDQIISGRDYRDRATGETTRQVVYSHDVDGALASSVSTEYNEDGSTFEIRKTYSFNDAGQVARVELGGDSIDTVVRQYQYDDNGNLVGETVSDSEGEFVSRYAYSYGPAPEPIVNMILRRMRFFP